MPVWQIAPLFLYTINHLNPTALKYFCINQGDQMAFSNLTSPYMSSLALSALFEYLCYGSTTIIICFIFFQYGDRLYVAGVYRRQI